MSLRKVEEVFDFLIAKHEEAVKHETEFDKGRASAYEEALLLLAKCDRFDIDEFIRASAAWVKASGIALLLLIPSALLG